MSYLEEDLNKTLKTILIVLVVIFVGTASFAGGFVTGHFVPLLQMRNIPLPAPALSTPSGDQQSATPQDLQTLFTPFWETWTIIHTQYVDQPVDNQKLLQGAIKGMVDSLGDKHSTYMDPKAVADFNAQLTSKQYEARFYTQREAAVIGTTFSAVSITFSLVVISQVKLEHMFVPFYLTVCLAGFAAAVIVPKLPPLSWKKDNYIDDTPRMPDDELIPAGHNAFSWGFDKALEKAASAGGIKAVLNEGVKNVVDMVFGIIPVVMAIGTLALIIAEHTPIFNYLGMPFIPLLELLHIPEATEASKTIVVGFADMFIPSILASSIESDMTRFVIAALSVTQLIYMSEVGALLIGSKIPVNFVELFVVFILRTLVTLPVIAGVAHLLF